MFNDASSNEFDPFITDFKLALGTTATLDPSIATFAMSYVEEVYSPVTNTF